MKLGFFTHPIHPRGRNYMETLQEDREAFILADKLGFSEGFIGEHLTDECENIPNCMMFLAALIDVTSQMKLGTAVINLPHSHPVVVASNAAMLDHLLAGRFLMGIGPGIHWSDAEAMGVIDQDRNAMFVEAIDQILAIWSGEPPYNLRGKYWTVSTERTIWPEIGLGPIAKPFQKPHPPILGAASNPNAAGLIALGRRGWWPISSDFLQSNYLAGHWANYSQGCKEGGHAAARANWRVARAIFVAEDDKVALAYGKNDPNSPYRFYLSQLSAKLRKAKLLRAFKGDPDMPDEDVTLDYMAETLVIAGSVNSVVDQVLALHEQVGGFGTLLYAGKNWNDVALSRKSMELMAERVMPAVNAALGHSIAAE
jgi:alkanesulfonate monooxygenase SsuD/methylene tetrahydromethanopterin reductase-like flavin-dependent oxidoreductase (luciferase family)